MLPRSLEIKPEEKYQLNLENTQLRYSMEARNDRLDAANSYHGGSHRAYWWWDWRRQKFRMWCGVYVGSTTYRNVFNLFRLSWNTFDLEVNIWWGWLFPFQRLCMVFVAPPSLFLHVLTELGAEGEKWKDISGSLYHCEKYSMGENWKWMRQSSNSYRGEMLVMG